MSSAITTLFRNNTNKAPRYPKLLEMPESESESWAVWFDGPAVSSDFMAQRLQPDDQRCEGV